MTVMGAVVSGTVGAIVVTVVVSTGAKVVAVTGFGTRFCIASVVEVVSG